VNDFDWPPVPYTEYLRQELEAQTRHDYLNPALDRRYDPVVVGGNAMHPIIQSGDVVLVDTGNTRPEDGRVIAVRVTGGRTLIGYWHPRDGNPVLQQERTDAVIDLAKYPNWSIYGIITKVIGRDIQLRPALPDVALQPEAARMDVTPGQAQWVIERLLADRRISAKDVNQYLAGMQGEIRDIEQRLADLRGAAGTPSAAAPTARTAVAPAKTRKRRAGGKKGHPRGIAGTLVVLLRSIPAAEHAAIAAIRANKGIKAAIGAARAAVKK
jgi:peptidase S24-like protein